MSRKSPAGHRLVQFCEVRSELKVKNVLLTGGKAALNSAVELGCSVVQLFTRLANTTWEFVCDKVRTMSREHRRMLMIIAAAATGVLAVGSVVLWLVRRKK